MAVASELLTVEGVQAPAWAVHPVDVTLTASESVPTVAKLMVKLGRTDVPKSVVLLGTFGQLHVQVLPLILQPGNVVVAGATAVAVELPLPQFV